MFLYISVVLSFILTVDSTLPNGIRLFDLPPGAETSRAGEPPFEMVLGYQAGIRNENRGLSGLASIASRYLASTPAGRALSLAAYAAGGEIEFLEELDRTAIRISVPRWARPMVLEQVAEYLKGPADTQAGLLDRARSAALEAASERGSPFRSKVEDEIRIGLLGSHPYHHPPGGWKSDIDQVTAGDITRFFNENFGTDRAFLGTSDPVPDDIRQRLSALPARPSRKVPEPANRVADAERTMRFQPDEPAGALIFASPVSGVFYRAWYSVLMLDKLVRRTVPGKPATAMMLSLDPYYWRLEIPVPAGPPGEAAEQELLQEINRLQFARARPADLEGARQDAAEFLDGRYAREWFASQGIEIHRQEGLRWIQSFTADDMRIAAHDLVIMNRVLASWPPRPVRNTVQVRSLTPAPEPVPATTLEAPGHSVALGAVAVPAFPPHTHPAGSYSTPEKLSSGLWLASSSISGLFLSGVETAGLPDGPHRTGPNGTLWTFSAGPEIDTVRAFQKYRADRILVLVPAAALDRARSLWGSFKSNDGDATVTTPQGNVANVDLSALIVLKAAIDRRLIEAGWSHDVSSHIDATVGGTMTIEGSPEIRARVMEWVRAFAVAPMSEADLAWVREVAIHHLNEVLPDVQSILWQRAPDYVLQDLQTIGATQVQDVAKLYF